MRIRFDKVNRIIKIYDGIKYLELSNSDNEFYYRFDSKIYNAPFDRINYLISEKSDDKCSINHNTPTIRIYSLNSLPIEKNLTLRNVIILIESVFNMGKNIFL